MIDPVLVTRKISLIAGDLRAAEPLARLSLEEYLRDPINEVAVERYLERLIGRMIDINYHVVTEMGHPPPKDYFEFTHHLTVAGWNYQRDQLAR